MKVLLVDASVTMRNIQKNVLRRLGIRNIVEAADGLEGLERLKEDRIRLVITGLDMPGMNGLKLVLAIRNAGNEVPVVMVTGRTDAKLVLAAAEAGVNGLVLKPFKVRTFKAKIKEVLGQ